MGRGGRVLVKEVPEKELKRNRFIGMWDNIYNDDTDKLFGFYDNNKTNKDRYKALMKWILTDDKSFKLRMISYYYDIDKNYYDYAMSRLESEYKETKTNDKNEENTQEDDEEFE